MSNVLGTVPEVVLAPVIAPIVAIDDAKQLSEVVVNVDLRSDDQKEQAVVGRILVLKLSIQRPNEILTPLKGQTIVNVNGTPASGKSTLAKWAQRFLNLKRLEYKSTIDNIVVIDTDLLFVPFWRSVQEGPDAPSLQAQWFANLHPTFRDFFLQQKESSLIICFGVADNTELYTDNDVTSVQYLLPNIAWNQRFFLQLPEGQLLKQRFARDIRKVVNNPTEMARLTSLESNQELHWSPDAVRLEHAADQMVYINTLGYTPMTYSALTKELSSLMQLWLPIRKPSVDKGTKRKR